MILQKIIYATIFLNSWEIEYQFLPTQTAVTSIPLVYHDDFNQPKIYIQREVEKRFKNAVIIMSHGVEFPIFFFQKGFFIYHQSDIRSLNKEIFALKDLFPGRPIVVWSCNAYKNSINIPDVYYFNDSCWIWPDSTPKDIVFHFMPSLKKFVLIWHENELGKLYPGSVWEMHGYSRDEMDLTYKFMCFPIGH